MKEQGIALNTLKREFKTLGRSNVYVMIIFADIIMSMVVSYSIFYNNSAFSGMIFQIVIAKFIFEYYNFFVIFLFAPSIDIAEEKELGTWDMINSQVSDNSSVIIGKIGFQVLFSSILVALSTASLSAVYLIHYGAFAGQTFIQSTTITKTYFATPYDQLTEINTSLIRNELGISFLIIGEILLVSIMVSAELAIIALGFSRIAKSRIVSVLFVVVFYIFITGVSPLLSLNTPSSILNFQSLMLSLNPQTLFSMIGNFTGLTTLSVVNGSSIYHLTVTRPITGSISYLIYYSIILISFLSLIFAPPKEVIVSWIRS